MKFASSFVRLLWIALVAAWSVPVHSATTTLDSLTDTWNGAGTTYYGLRLSITDTASAAASRAFQLNGGAAGTTSLFYVDKSGNGVAAGTLTGTGLTASSTNATIGWSDAILNRGAANRLDLRNSTSAQQFRVWNTYTDSSNGEWGGMDWQTAANELSVGAFANGTGTKRQLRMEGATISIRPLTGSTAAAWNFTSAGHLLAGADNTYDIGASGATRPRLIYTAGGAVLNNIAIGSGASSSLIRITASSDGVLKITNDATTDVNRIQLGGTSSSFPAIKRSGTSVALRLADDSADAGLTAGTATFSGDVALSKTVTAAGTTGAQTINKSSGSVNFAAAATSLVVTDSLVTTSSIIIATVASNDATMKSVAVVAGSGSFTLYPNAAPTAETRVNFIITN